MSGRALLAWNLRQLRTARDISQEKLAADLGFGRAWVSSVENQKLGISVDQLDRLAQGLGVTIPDLFAQPPAGAAWPEPLPKGRRRP